MEKIRGSERLKKIADYAIEGGTILDIGSDHAYLPIYLVKEELVSQAIAGEVVEGPYEKAKKEVANQALTNKISVRLGNGFEVLKKNESINTVFICGMGGLLISEIIEKGEKQNKIPKNSRLVLQANNKEKELRVNLSHWNFQIIEESIVKENNKFYEIMVVKKVENQPIYSKEEFSYGPILLKEKNSIFQEKWQKIIDKNKEILENLDKNKHLQEINKLREKNKEIRKVVF